jgi:hypothetical protein
MAGNPRDVTKTSQEYSTETRDVENSKTGTSKFEVIDQLQKRCLKAGVLEVLLLCSSKPDHLLAIQITTLGIVATNS